MCGPLVKLFVPNAGVMLNYFVGMKLKEFKLDDGVMGGFPVICFIP